MKKYKVIALNATGVNGKVHYAKEVLTADQLGGEKRANELAIKGFVELIEQPKKVDIKSNSKKSK